MNSGTVTLHSQLMLEIIESLQKQGMVSLRQKILTSLPDDIFPYGSKLWWEQETLKARHEVKQNKGKRFDSAADAVKYLQTLW